MELIHAFLDTITPFIIMVFYYLVWFDIHGKQQGSYLMVGVGGGLGWIVHFCVFIPMGLTSLFNGITLLLFETFKHPAA